MKNIVVLGHRLSKDGKMSQALLTRLRLAATIYSPRDVVVVSGGKVQCGVHTEAYVMKRALSAMLPGATIISEARSKSTGENITKCYKILCRSSNPTVVVTSPGHSRKVRRVLAKLGIPWTVTSSLTG